MFTSRHFVYVLIPVGLACAGTSFQAVAADVGRLFFTPAERGALEARRGAPLKPRDVPAPVAAPSQPATVVEAPPAPAPVTLNGHIVSSNGRSTTWVNNVPRYDSFRLGTDGQIAIPTGDGTRRAPLKVGQTFDVQTGTRDSVGKKAVTVGKP